MKTIYGISIKEVPGLITVATAIAFAATIIYLIGFGIGFGEWILPYFGAKDLVTLSIQWIAPIIVGWTIFGLAYHLFRRAWLFDVILIAVASAFLLAAWKLGVSPTKTGGLLIFVIGSIVALGIAALSLREFNKSERMLDSIESVASPDKSAFMETISRRRGIAIHAAIAFLVMIVLIRGLSRGFGAAHPSRAMHEIQIDDMEGPLQGNLVFYLDDLIIFRTYKSGAIFVARHADVVFLKSTSSHDDPAESR